MEAAQQQEQQQYHSWKLNVRAKAKNLNFKLVASNFLPNCKYFPFSLSLKYCRFFIHLKSQTHTSPNRKKPKIFKSKLPRFLQRLRTRQRSKNNRVISSKPKNLKATISQSSVVLGNLTLFVQSIYQQDKDGIFILGSIVCICFACLFKNFMATKAWTFLVFVIGALVFCSNVMHLRFISHFDHHYLSGFLWRAFKNAASSACLYILSQNIPPVSFLDKKITGTAMFLVSVYLFRALILYAVAETSVCKCKGLLILKYLVEVGKYWVDYMKLGVENIQGPASAFPRILGHEAAGVVESVEENVEEVKEGDIVIPVFQRNCGECRDCKYPTGNICSKFPEDFYCGMPSDGSSRFKDKNGEKLHHTLPMSPDFPIDEAYLLSRGVSTGLGAAWKVAEVEEGSTVAIFGLGAVGLAVTRVFLTPR
ncbi:Alcohol dehydrogenase-like 7 [Capsicum annuum]|nr:Alcohol dehydrogenase-like 7 [Capsicum annuum]